MDGRSLKGESLRAGMGTHPQTLGALRGLRVGGKRAKAKGLKLKAKVVWLKLKWESLRVRGPPILKQLGALREREGLGFGLKGPPRRTPGLGALRDPRTSRAGGHWCGAWAPGAGEPLAPLGSLREPWGPLEFPQGVRGGPRLPRGSQGPQGISGIQGPGALEGPPGLLPGPGAPELGAWTPGTGRPLGPSRPGGPPVAPGPPRLRGLGAQGPFLPTQGLPGLRASRTQGPSGAQPWGAGGAGSFSLTPPEGTQDSWALRGWAGGRGRGGEGDS